MKCQIKHRFTGNVLFELDVSSIKLAVEAAVKAKADLERADLRGADLVRADLRGAYLRGADLVEADLRGADLVRADLRRTYLVEAYLRGADHLRGANLGNEKNPIEDIKQVGNIGSRGGVTIAFKCKTSIEINCGCWWGTIGEFEQRVKEVHGDNKHGKDYIAMIEFLRKIWQ